MTTYYVGAGGSDAGAGTSWGARWATIGKALGADGISSCDTVYVAPGTYRETVTVAMTAAVATTSIIGDVDGSHTSGVPGPVTWTGNTKTDWITATTAALTATSKNFLSFSNLIFENANSVPWFSMTTCTNITFTNCAFIAHSTLQASATLIMKVDVDNHWLFDRCLFVTFHSGGNVVLGPICPTSTTADYNIGITAQNCLVYSFSGAANVGFITATTSGANSFKPGGIAVRNCSVFGGPALYTNSASMATSIPCTLYDSLVMCGNDAAAKANSAGQIVEDYNHLISNTPRQNVTAGTHSFVSAFGRLSFGQEMIWGGQLRPLGTPLPGSPVLGFGAFTSPLSVDFLNKARPSGTDLLVTSGTFTSGGTATATDSGASFGSSGQVTGATVKITGGTGSGQTMVIKSHTNTVLTVYGTWNTQPDNTSTYVIYRGSPSFTGKATSGGATSLTQSNATWDTNLWAGWTVEITGGTGSGQTNTITSNTGTALTVPTWGTNPDNTSTYVIYRQTGVNTPLRAAGALERHDTAVKETTTTDAGSVAITITGPGDHQFQIPVDAVSTTVTVKVNYDSVHGTSSPPQAQLLAAPEIGYAGETVTASASTGSWLTLTFAAFTPSAKSIVTLRLISRSAAPSGQAHFDTVTVT